MLQSTKIIVLDEATANVDLQTDILIQAKIRDQLDKYHATVIIIAHRIATVIDSDRILVMAEGQSVEYDHPFKLLADDIENDFITNDEGYFAKMVNATGIESSQSLFNIAKEKY